MDGKFVIYSVLKKGSSKKRNRKPLSSTILACALCLSRLTRPAYRLHPRDSPQYSPSKPVIFRYCTSRHSLLKTMDGVEEHEFSSLGIRVRAPVIGDSSARTSHYPPTRFVVVWETEPEYAICTSRCEKHHIGVPCLSLSSLKKGHGFDPKM